MNKFVIIGIKDLSRPLLIENADDFIDNKGKETKQGKEALKYIDGKIFGTIETELSLKTLRQKFYKPVKQNKNIDKNY